ncbi:MULTISPECIES: class F sortase [unclassified Rathayibacter]|uniref:class F sortase n=1 Tax=unclassified Rathayibacter TaxID=2609250 RepID=UPI000CE79BF1|nr:MULTISPECIES: class F sortase [unclassified Rathayibacter]PPG06018.1 class F sortase [Rathayibacter sp. AY2B1]PPG73464.1 class F sortase [Rathayibacter sp. AY1F4]
MSRSPFPLRVLAVVGLIVAGAGLAGCAAQEFRVEPAPAAVSSAPQQPVPATVPSSPAAALPEAVPSVPVADARLGATPAPTALAPERLVVDGLPVDMAVEPVGVADDGTMELVPDTQVAGWYRFGAGLDEPEGTVVIAAHVDSLAYGLGPFVELKKAVPGQTVTLTGADGAERAYTVSTVETTEKTTVDLSAVFAADGPPRLVLITCGGDFDYDTRHYLSNVVVTAVPAG